MDKTAYICRMCGRAMEEDRGLCPLCGAAVRLRGIDGPEREPVRRPGHQNLRRRRK